MKTKLDPITFEVIRSSFDHITKMMSQTLQKISFSPILYDMVDFSNALFDSNARLIGQTTNVPVHLAAMHFSVEAAVHKFENNFEEGDIVVLNDPYMGGTHIPDVTFVTPIFYKEKIVAFAASRGHWADLGGAATGSEVPGATHIVEEGLRIPPTKIYERRKPVTSVIEIIRNNSRTPYFIEGDIRAHLGALNTAEKYVLNLIRKYGVETVTACMEEALNYTERRTRNAIRTLPDGVYEAEDYIETDGRRTESMKIKATMSIAGENIIVDFTGTDAAVDGPINYPLAGTHSAVYFALKFFLDPDAPPNSGMYRPITIIAPENTIVNPKWPAPVYYGNLITSEKIADVMWQCLEKVIPDRIVGMPFADANPITFGIYDSTDGTSYSFGDLPPGGWGGTPYSDGMSATYCRHGNCMDLSPEVAELLYPIYCLERELVVDSGGPGRHRGGLSLRETFKMLKDGVVTIGMGRTKSGPPSVCGGRAGMPGKIIKNAGTSNEEVCGGYDKNENWQISMFANKELKAGETITIITQGGGGWGNPAERSIQDILEDLKDGYVTKDKLVKDYGISI